MQPETPVGETPVVTDPKTLPNPTPAPQVPAEDPAIEAARKRAEQAEMQANMLRNKLKEKEDAEAAAQTKKLEEDNKFKELYDASQAKLKELEAESEKKDRDNALKAKSDTILAEYPDEVKNLAQELGVNLTDTDEDTVEAFKAKLDKVSGSIKAPKVTPNNPGNRTPPVTEKTAQEMHEIMRDPAKFQEYTQKNLKGVKAMTGPRE